MKRARFSEREGFAPTDAEIKIRHDAPGPLRAAIPRMLYDCDVMRPTPLREVVCGVLRTSPSPGNWSDFPRPPSLPRSPTSS